MASFFVLREDVPDDMQCLWSIKQRPLRTTSWQEQRGTGLNPLIICKRCCHLWGHRVFHLFYLPISQMQFKFPSANAFWDRDIFVGDCSLISRRTSEGYHFSIFFLKIYYIFMSKTISKNCEAKSSQFWIKSRRQKSYYLGLVN